MLIVLLAVLAITGAAFGIFQSSVVAPRTASDEGYYRTLATMMQTLTEMTPTKLDPRFTDSTGSGLADAPDPSLCIDPPKLTFSYVAGSDADKYQKVFQPLMDYISQATGKPVEYKAYAGNDDEINAIAADQLTIAVLNTGGVTVAVNRAGFIPTSKIPVHDGTMQVEIIVPADSPIQTPNDLKGRELTLSQPQSNSGFRAPIVLLQNDYMLQPGRDYHIRISGTQEQSLAGLTRNPPEYEAAAVASDMLNRGLAHGDFKESQIRVIYASKAFPTASIGYVYNLKPELAAKIKAALLSFDCKGTTIETEFAPGKVTKFLPVDYKTDWQIVRDLDAEIVQMGQQAGQ
jgi:phosphonate transport system substrate-binding protein